MSNDVNSVCSLFVLIFLCVFYFLVIRKTDTTVDGIGKGSDEKCVGGEEQGVDGTFSNISDIAIAKRVKLNPVIEFFVKRKVVSLWSGSSNNVNLLVEDCSKTAAVA